MEFVTHLVPVTPGTQQDKYMLQTHACLAHVSDWDRDEEQQVFCMPAVVAYAGDQQVTATDTRITSATLDNDDDARTHLHS